MHEPQLTAPAWSGVHVPHNMAPAQWSAGRGYFQRFSASFISRGGQKQAAPLRPRSISCAQMSRAPGVMVPLTNEEAEDG